MGTKADTVPVLCVCYSTFVAIFSCRDLPDPEIEPTSLASAALAGRFFTTLLHICIDDLICKAEIEKELENKYMDAKG